MINLKCLRIKINGGKNMNLKIRISDQGKETTVNVEQGINLLSCLQDENTSVHAPCGGRGTCGKCTVEIKGKGKVLACKTIVDASLIEDNSNEIVVILPEKTKPRILSEGFIPEHKINPFVKKTKVELSVPSVEDQIPDDTRVEQATSHKVPFHLLTELSRILRDNNFNLSYSYRTDTNEIIDFDDPSLDNKLHGIAIDIGTTTVAGFLYDLETGRHLKTSSCLNSQRIHGADVISRIDFADSSYENLKKMQRLIYNDIMNIVFELTERVEDVKVLSFAGNTTMMHLLCGINPIAIAKAPFIPTSVTGRIVYFFEIFNCIDSKLLFNPVCILLPSIAGYVGADITAGLLTCDMDKDNKISLLIDIGTNGEIALSVNGDIITCSTAAGPAFEGANLSCGIGGVTGAIDKVNIAENELSFTTISDRKPIGICGSGIVSSLASLLHLGIIDETGRFEDDTNAFSEINKKRLTKINGETSFVFYFDEKNNPEVYLTQKDIREIQNAKAAVCAGVELLIEKKGLTQSDIDEVYIAGGFGNYLNIDDAFAIGLLPQKLKGKTKMTGNTSVVGATLCLLDSDMMDRCEDIRQKVTYYELSSDKRFTDLYIDAMMFEA